MGSRRAAAAAVVTGLTGLLALPGAGTAAVKIEPGKVTVSTGAASAVVDRAPLRIAFRAGGRTVLRQAAGEGGPSTLAPTLDPEPFTLEREPDNARYAPLTYEVGSETRAQWNGSFWAGNLLFSRRSGTVHRAVRVTAARRAGRGAVLTLATTEPGRTLTLRIAPDRGGALRVRVTPASPAGIITMGDSFTSPAGERFHGFGGRHGELDKRGQKVYGWTEQENFGGRDTLSATSLLPSLVEQGTDFTLAQLGGGPQSEADLPGGYERYMIPGGRNGAYYPQNLFVSSRGYGFMLNETRFSRWRMASDGPAWQVQASAPRLDYTVAPGGPARASARLTAINGRHLVPPRWAQDTTIWRAVQILRTTETAETYLAKINRDLRDIKRFRAPVKAYAFEGWGLIGVPATRRIIRRLDRMGIRTILYHRAYVSNDPLNTQPKGDYEFVLRNGLAAKDASGKPFFYDANGAPGVVLDFTNPATVRWWKRRIELTLDMGADGFMQDFGEQVQEDMRFANGETGATMHNRYPVLFHRTTRRIVDAYDRRKGRREPTWVFTRSGFSGRPGSAAYEMGNFPGDETSDWSAGSGLRSLAPDMLNRAVGGAFGFTTDIGGYADLLTGPPDAELFTRWSEWSALTPFFRVHNSSTTGTRMPWSYSPAVLRRWKALAALHSRALPYMRRLWRSARRTGVPPTRPLWLAFPGDRRAAGQDQQWLLGRDVLVAPVVEEGARARSVYFPRGCWRDPRGGRPVKGPASRRVAAALGRLPFFFRCGTRPFRAGG